jgi:TrmH family RNA methyltransferase
MTIMLSIIIIEPENPGNVGAIARSMANFGHNDLVLINPKCDPLDEEAMRRAMHGRKVLEKARTADMKILDEFDTLVATTAKLGTDYNIPRSPIFPEELGNKIAGLDKRAGIGIVIGRESTGLSNDEISRCDFVCTIQAHKDYPTLNISHAVAIILYEIFRASDGEAKTGKQIMPAGRKEKEAFAKELDDVIDSMDFSTEEKKETQKVVWKRLIAKSMLTQRELFSLFGFLRKIKEIKRQGER